MNNSYKKTVVYSSFGSYKKNDRLFSEEDYVALMQFRKNYIMKLHALLRERLPRRPTINIRIPKKVSPYDVSTPRNLNNLFNQKIAGLTNENSIKKASRDTLVFTDIQIVIKYKQFYSGDNIWTYEFIFNIANPKNKEIVQNIVPKEVDGVNIQDTVFESVKELSEEAVTAIKEFSPRRYFRPPSNVNNGGPGYKRSLNRWTSKVRAKARKTRKN